MIRTSIIMPDGLSDRAHAHGINVSKVCANAVREMIRKIEYDAARSHSSKVHSETATAHDPSDGVV